MQLVDGGAGVQRQGESPLRVGRRRERRHHARLAELRVAPEAAEVGGDEAHVVAGLAEAALDRAEEAGEQRDTRAA